MFSKSVHYHENVLEVLKCPGEIIFSLFAKSETLIHSRKHICVSLELRLDYSWKQA